MAVQYRLRLIRLVPASGMSYGSDNFGDKTYGARTTDAADLQRYEIVPTRQSPSEIPAIVRRRRDNRASFSCWIMAFQSEYEGPERAGTKLDLTGVSTAILNLNRVTPPPNEQGFFEQGFHYPMTKHLPTQTLNVTVTDEGDPDQTLQPGSYRMSISLEFVSGRRYTVPADDSMVGMVVDSPEVVRTDGPPISPP